MKTAQAFLVLLIGTALTIAPLSAQRPGGGGHHGGGHGGGHSAPSMSGGGRPSSSHSHSAGISSRPSTSHYSSSSSRPSVSSHPGSSRPTANYGGHSSTKGPGTSHRPTGMAGTRGGASSHAHYGSKPIGHTKGTTSRPTASAPKGGHVGTAPAKGGHPGHAGIVPAKSGRPGGPAGVPGHHYATPHHPHHPMPPAVRHIRPAPYFHHPIHGGMIHMHPIFWDPVPFHVHCWPGFWAYCHGYWHDYHVSDVVVVREYVREKYDTDLITYVMSDNIMYALSRADGDTYLQVFDKDDNLLAQQKVSDKYILMEIDKENGGCWIMKKKNKDPLLFLYNDGELLIYEAD